MFDSMTAPAGAEGAMSPVARARRFSRREVAGALERELLTAALIIGDAARGMEITPQRRTRLAVAARRCGEAAQGIWRVR